MKDVGLKVLRFSGREIFNSTQGVLEKIWWPLMILKISPLPSFPKRGFRVSTEKSEAPNKSRIIKISAAQH
jgi:hypothetical protein